MFTFFIIYIKTSGKNINFDDKKIKRTSFYKNKKINNIEDIYVNNILVSKKSHTVQQILINTHWI